MIVVIDPDVVRVVEDATAFELEGGICTCKRGEKL